MQLDPADQQRQPDTDLDLGIDIGIGMCGHRYTWTCACMDMQMHGHGMHMGIGMCPCIGMCIDTWHICVAAMVSLIEGGILALRRWVQNTQLAFSIFPFFWFLTNHPNGSAPNAWFHLHYPHHPNTTAFNTTALHPPNHTECPTRLTCELLLFASSAMRRTSHGCANAALTSAATK